MSEHVDPEGSIRIEGGRDGIAAGCSIYFVFDGDWANLYEDFPHDEKEARQWFVQEVEHLLKVSNDETREDDQAERPSGPVDSEGA